MAEFIELLAHSSIYHIDNQICIKRDVIMLTVEGNYG